MDIFQPIQNLADFFTFNLMSLPKGSFLSEAVNYFIYDIIKIGLLLVLINYIMAITRYYFPTEKVKNILAKRRWFGLDYMVAALLGVVTPFCSCSSIPLFIGFLSAGIPLGITFTFLISSPLVNEASLYLFPALFGLKVTLVYNLIGITVSILGGMFIQSLKFENYVNRDLIKAGRHKSDEESEKIQFKDLLNYWWNDGWNITKQVFPYVLMGVGLGALIHGFVPISFVERYISHRAFWSIPAAVILGAPLYANSVAVIPVMEALIEKGVPIGTALTFMISIVTLSLPEILMLKKVMKWQLLLLFFGITIFGIMLMGYIFNILF